ncbi:MAG: PEGA domain-containing protein [Minicystis sp.]
MIDRGRLFRIAVFLAAVVSVAGAVACSGAGADAQSAVPLATATPDDPPAREEPATLDVIATPDADVKIDGKPVGKTPLKGFKVSPGSHDVTFIDDTGPRTMTVNVEPGEGKTVKSDRPPTPIEKKR